MKKSIIFSLCLSITALTACGQTNDSALNDERQFDGTEFVRNELNSTQKDTQYTDDRTAVNNGKNFTDLDRTQPTENAEVAAIEDVIKAQGMDPGQIWANGNHLWVTAYTNEEVPDSKRIKKEGELHKAIVKAVPQYFVEVSVKEK